MRTKEPSARSSRALLLVGLVFGSAAQGLRRRYPALIPAIAGASRNAAYLIAIGPTTQVEPYLEAYLAERKLAGPKMTATWKRKMRRESDHEYLVAKAEDERLDRFGLKHADLPCLLFYCVATKTVLSKVRIPPSAWSSDARFATFRNLMCERLSLKELEACVVSEHAGKTIDAFRRHVRRLEVEIAALGRGRDEDWISTQEASRLTGRSRQSLLRDLRKGRITSFRASTDSPTEPHRFSRIELEEEYGRRKST